MNRRHPHAMPLSAAALRAVCMGAWLCTAAASAGATAGIYSCIDGAGKRLTSDRPIPECLDREQRVLNKDGSQKQTLPPRMNAEERAQDEERQRVKAQQEAARKDATRRDRNLMLRYPDEPTHRKAREAALDDLRKGIALSERHLIDLQDSRKPLQADAEFYQGKRLPGKLKAKLEANDAQQQAQKDIIQNQHAETGRINAIYDAELAHLRKLWAGAAPGSLNFEPPRAGPAP
jgi:hypothetical protein